MTESREERRDRYVEAFQAEADSAKPYADIAMAVADAEQVELRRQVAAVEALADEWAGRWDVPHAGRFEPDAKAYRTAAVELTAALTSVGRTESAPEADPMRCDNCGTPEAECPGLPESACCCKFCAHSRTDAAVTPDEAGA